MAIHVAQMAGVEEKRQIFDALTVNSARTLGLADYGLKVGGNADLVVLQARDAAEALRLKANRLFVIRRGKVIAQSAPRVSRLFLEGRPDSIDAARDAIPPA